MPTQNSSRQEEPARRILARVKRRIRSAFAPRNTLEKKLSPEDGAYVYSLLRDDIEACLRDASIPTASWTCARYASRG
jgi:hypothetical protein